MATYNGAQYIKQQIESIINQTHKNIEIIIQDDGSTDDTVPILETYAATDDRIRIIRNEKNLGINQNFYELIKKASGQFIAISDQDDIWDLNKLEILLKEIGGASLIYTDSTLINSEGGKIGRTILQHLGHQPKYGRLITNLFEKNTISGHACMFKSCIKQTILKLRYKNFGEHFMYDQLIGTVASFAAGVKYHNTPLTLHRIHNSNSCNTLSTSKELSPKTTKENRKEKHARRRSKTLYFTRKKQRVHQYIYRSYRKRLSLIHLFDIYGELKNNPFGEKKTIKSKFQHSFFDITLYRRLLKLEVNKDEAKSLSYGKYYYLLLKWM
tara:strand:- start:3626 stop:4603 length:978 start_codon:yes stop_codon:yes gene_type:complete